jgi:transcriptional/translational regulatory protein YebC/TACO1
MMAALEAGADDFVADGDFYEIYTEPEDFEQVKEKLEAEGIEFVEASIAMIPDNTVEITDPEEARKALSLIEQLEDHDDVQNVFTNLEIAPETAEMLGSE